MAPSLTLIDGGEHRTFTEHPMETARRALRDAAEIEGEEWAALCRRIASSLPDRTLEVGAEREWNRTQERWERRREHAAEASNAWDRLPVPARESLLLHMLAGERLIIPELTSRMNAELGYPPGTDERGGASPSAVYGSQVRRLVTRMHRAGQLDRVAEPAPGAKIRHRYFRNRTLDGPIIELEAAYQEGGE